MKIVRVMGRLGAALAIMSVAACGGGGNGPVTTTPTAPPTPTPPAPPKTVNILPGTPATIASPAFPSVPQALPLATGATPDLAANLPANGTVFPLLQAGLLVHETQAQGITNDTGATLTLTGTQLVGGVAQPVFELKVPGLSIDVPNIGGGLTSVTLPDGRKFQAALVGLQYSVYGSWSQSPTTVGGLSNAIFVGLSGYQTPNANVPTGTATYVGTGTSGGVIGYIAIPSGTGTITGGTVTGDANLNVNFATGAVTGSLTNMNVDLASGATMPWNNVGLAGTMSGATLSGTTTSTGTPPSGAGSFDASSTGTFNGSLFGPHGEEMGAIWNLHDPTGQGKTAEGFFGTTKH